jgi:hypothetical protein
MSGGYTWKLQSLCNSYRIILKIVYLLIVDNKNEEKPARSLKYSKSALSYYS